jgi:hypothetical protein
VIQNIPFSFIAELVIEWNYGNSEINSYQASVATVHPGNCRAEGSLGGRCLEFL